MDIFPDDEFMAWFFTYFLDAASCPHCNADIYEDEIIEKGKDFIAWPSKKLVILSDDQRNHESMFNGQGWRVFLLPLDDNQINEIIELIK